jgi:hypothetical protein
MATGMYIWHAPHSRRVVCEDAYKEGRHLPEWMHTGPMRMLLIYFTNISKLCVWYDIIQYMCILCWWRIGEDVAEFIHWSCCHAERFTGQGALGIERCVRTGDWEAWVRGEGSTSWVECYYCSWDVFLVQVSFTGGSIRGHVPGFGWTCPGGGGFAGGATCGAREKRQLGAAHARVRGIHVLYGSIAWHSRCLAVFTCKRR